MVDMKSKHLVFAGGTKKRNFKEKAAKNDKQGGNSHSKTVKTMSLKSKSPKKSQIKSLKIKCLFLKRT